MAFENYPAVPVLRVSENRKFENVGESPEKGSCTREEEDSLETNVSRDATAQELLSRLSDTENYPDGCLAPTRSSG